MRKLASIKVIDKIQPIDGADMIELATVGGWKVVVAKNVGHKEGDWVVYCEVDSFLPIEPEFEFLRKSSYKKMGEQEGFRLKTIRLRGQISQGLIIPLKDAHELIHRNEPTTSVGLTQGQDVSELLGIVKYEPPIPANLQGEVEGQFPSFIQKTDEERIQNLASEYEEFKIQSQHQFYVTEKLDGSSATFYFNDGKFGVCSRNLELKETEGNTFWKVARQLNLEEKLRALGKNIALQGELIGEGIQKNPYKIKGQTVRFFNVFDIDNYKKLSVLELRNIVEDIMKLETVPILNEAYALPETVNDMLLAAEGKSMLNTNTEREGLVIRSLDNTISFKAISNKFLLKNEN